MGNVVLGMFAARNDFCWACGIGSQRDSAIDYWRHLEIHHIAKMGRVHEDWNLSRLCKMCHDLAEGHSIRVDGELLPKLLPKHVFWLKSRIDPRSFDMERLVKQWRVGRPDEPEEPPQWYWEQFKKWQGCSYPEPPVQLSARVDYG